MATTQTRSNIPVIVSIILAALSFTFSAYASYSLNDKDLATRITAVEVFQKTRAETTMDRLNRIENKVDLILLNQMKPLR